jgi:chitinase
VGGANSALSFRAATGSLNLPLLITNLTNFVSRYGYDGIDIDWEEFLPTDTNQFSNLIRALRSALNGLSTNKLLTAAALPYARAADPPAFIFTTLAPLQAEIDQINFMTYRLSGAFPGWVTWFTAPLFDGGLRFPNTTRLVPSADAVVTNAISNGIASSKIGIGIYCSGEAWVGGSGTSTGGASQPRQSWDQASPPLVTNIPYHLIADTYLQSNQYRWDDIAQAPYLTMDGSNTNDVFVSYEDERSCQTKVSYARNRRLGGIMLFELGNGYRANQPSRARHPLLHAIKQSLATPKWTELRRDGQSIALSFRTLPLGLYRVQYANRLRPLVWDTLSNNVQGSGEIVQVFDPGPTTRQTFRVYRVQTPP